MVTFIENFILGVSLTLPLGPVTLEILRRGIILGYAHSLKTACGAFCAELTYFFMIYLGLSRFSENFLVKYILGFLGVSFLFYYSYTNIKEFFSTSSSLSKKILNDNSFLVGYAITFLNPLNFFMWVGIIGSFFASSATFFISSGVLYGIAVSLLIVSGLSQLGNKLLKKKNMKYVSLAAGLFLFFYGLRLLFSLFEN